MKEEQVNYSQTSSHEEEPPAQLETSRELIHSGTGE